MRYTFLFVLFPLFAAPVFAERAPTLGETANVEDALEAVGCNSGYIDVDEKDGVVTKYTVEDAECSEGGLWDLELDPEFKVTKREADG